MTNWTGLQNYMTQNEPTEEQKKSLQMFDIWALVLQERQRQTKKWGHTSFESVARYVLNERGLPGDDLPDDMLKFIGIRTMEIVLNEEVGEVSRAILEDDLVGLQEELVQVAAVAVAMLEYSRKS